jgi:TolB-like protein
MLITYLSNSPEELIVRQTESINNLIQSKGLTNYASVTPSFASTISKRLNAKVFIYGSIKQAGSTMRVNAQIIDTRTEEALKSFEIEGSSNEEMIFGIIDSLKKMVKNYLIISNLKKDLSHAVQQLAFTNSPEAFRYYISGNNCFAKGDYATAITWYLQALNIDSSFVTAATWISIAYLNRGLYNEGKKWCLKIYKKREQLLI